MNWQGRLRAQITLTAPDGTTQYSAKWKGDDIGGTKQVAQFTFPYFNGTVVQDLSSVGRTFPLSLIFEGDDHDITAWNFQLAFLSQRGTWTVVHPVYGSLTLQGLTINLKADPTGSGNQTVVETTWIEPSPAKAIASSAELAASIQSQVSAVNAAASASLSAGVDLTDAEQASAAIQQGTNGLAVFDGSTLASLAKASADISNAVNTAYESALSAIQQTPSDLLSFASYAQNIYTVLSTVPTDLTTKLTAFSDLASGLIDQILGGTDATVTAAANVSECLLTGALTGAALAISVTEPATREEAVTAITTLSAMFSAITAGLDGVQASTGANFLENQYFSGRLTFIALARLIGTTIQYLLSQIFDLRIAKHITLSVPKPPLRIVLEEYGTEYDSAGNSYLDLFIAANRLTGDAILLLPAGWQGVVYV